MTPLLRLPLLSLLTVLSSMRAPAADEDPCAQPAPAEMARDAGVTLPRLPWHVANIWWNLEGEVKNFESLRIPVTIDRDVPEAYNLYIAPVGLARINGLDFYGGLQTNINGWPDRESRKRVHRGRGAIFSRWSHDKKTPIGLNHVREAGEDCLVESAGYEGEFASVRRPLKWTRGTWIYEVRKLETVEVDGKSFTWFQCRVQSPQGEWREIGALKFEGSEFTYWNRHSAFVEVYSTQPLPRSGIPRVQVTFGWPEINGRPARVNDSFAFYPNQDTQAAPDCAKVVADGSNARVDVGPIFKREEQTRRHSLRLIAPENAPAAATTP